MSDNDPKTLLKDILAAQRIRRGDPEHARLRSLRSQVESCLREAFGTRPKIKYAGSRAKNTMIRSAFDLDLTCYFDAGDDTAGTSLEEIYQNTQRALSSSFYVTARRSALRLTPKVGPRDVHVDVIPGRFTDATRTEAYLYQAGAEKRRLKTNVDAHINHVRTSGHSDVIALFKLWATTKRVPIKTFALELAVIDALEDEPSTDLNERIATVLERFRIDIDSIRVEDPANPTGNDLSHLWNEDVRDALRTAAEDTFDAAGAAGVLLPESDRAVLAAAAGGAAGFAAGYLFAKEGEDGQRKFNWGAAIVAGVAVWGICR